MTNILGMCSPKHVRAGKNGQNVFCSKQTPNLGVKKHYIHRTQDLYINSYFRSVFRTVPNNISEMHALFLNKNERRKEEKYPLNLQLSHLFFQSNFRLHSLFKKVHIIISGQSKKYIILGEKEKNFKFIALLSSLKMSM